MSTNKVIRNKILLITYMLLYIKYSENYGEALGSPASERDNQAQAKQNSETM